MAYDMNVRIHDVVHHPRTARHIGCSGMSIVLWHPCAPGRHAID